jgi:2',3'-cyclic-nucleotide 2'-phosphodiesterase (5'-nucleotidase family)
MFGRGQITPYKLFYDRILAQAVAKIVKRTLSFFICLVFIVAVRADAAKPETLTIIQLNDVYEVFPVPTLVDHKVEPRGGLEYVGTMIDEYRKRGPVLVLHAGDFLSPSLLSIKFKHEGKQMVDAMNAIKTDFATFGNHEFDFGCRVLGQRIDQSNFQWLSSNVKFPTEMSNLASKIKPYRILKIAGLRVGIFALTVPLEPLEGCGVQPIQFLDPFETAKSMVAKLKTQQVDLIVALTHLRIKEDRLIAELNPDIDFIVGGHDHEPMVEVVGKTLITKAGANAVALGVIGIKGIRTGKDWVVQKDWKRVDVNPKTTKPSPAVSAALAPYRNQLQSFEKIIGSTEVPLDVREDTVREKESNFANYLTDVMRNEAGADLALINGGAFRGDRVIPPGPLTTNDLYTVLLFENDIVTIEISGRKLLEALENGVSLVGEKAGRFPQVSGMKFTFDPDQPVGQRVTKVTIGGEPLDLGKTYTLATIDFLLNHGFIDGYQLPKDKVVHGNNLNEAILRSLQKGPIHCQVEGRIFQE